MCGIVGYVGRSEAAPVLLGGLRRLEYRGYDSAGLTISAGGKLSTRKSVGRIQNLASLVESTPAPGFCGISHTRWATHGAVTEENAHPHFDRSGKLALVHNGVVENYRTLREKLEERGIGFDSQTDSEVLAKWIGIHLEELPDDPDKDWLLSGLRNALGEVGGTYGIAMVHADVPGVLIGARKGSPLVVGLSEGEHFLASDAGAIVPHTREVMFLQDFEIAVLEADSLEITGPGGGRPAKEIQTLQFTAEDVDKGEHAHYMLKEIHEQPESLRNALRGRLSTEEASAKLGGLNMSNAELRGIERIVLCGCGTALHAAMLGEYAIEALAKIPVEVEFASELRYRNLPMTKDTLVIAISQSGETADTLAALRECQRKGHRTLAICNNVGSTIARESDGGVYLHAGPEIGVAATKSFTSQSTILVLLALLLGRIRNLSHGEGMALLHELEALPDLVTQCLATEDAVRKVAQKYHKCPAFLFFGRQANYPLALEAALKLKEISYLPSFGHPSAELKHGVIALVSPETPSIFIAPEDSVFEKNLSNIEEVKARRGPVIVVSDSEHPHLREVADEILPIPKASEFLAPILAAIPLQLFAYHIALELGCDIDKPRNLAKSVTVE